MFDKALNTPLTCLDVTYFTFPVFYLLCDFKEKEWDS